MTENEMVEKAMAESLETKIQKAIGLLKLYEERAKMHHPDGYWLAFSGGKDSDVILELAKMAGVKHRAVYNVTTIDPPELVRYIKREHPTVIFNHPKLTLFNRMLATPVGPPTRRIRWCCADYKEAGGDCWCKIIGVRAQESEKRKTLWRQVVPNTRSKMGFIFCPILYWTTEDVWNFHTLRKLQFCEVYNEEGVNRLGCIGCPLIDKYHKEREFKRWPRYAMLWERAVRKHWEIWHDRQKPNGDYYFSHKFKNADESWMYYHFDNRLRDKKRDCQSNYMLAKQVDMDENVFKFLMKSHWK